MAEGGGFQNESKFVKGSVSKLKLQGRELKLILLEITLLEYCLTAVSECLWEDLRSQNTPTRLCERLNTTQTNRSQAHY